MVTNKQEMAFTITNRHNKGRLIGLLYLIIAITGGFSIGYMPSESIHLDNSLLTFAKFQKKIEVVFLLKKNHTI